MSFMISTIFNHSAFQICPYIQVLVRQASHWDSYMGIM